MGRQLQESLKPLEIIPDHFNRNRIIDINNNVIALNRPSYPPVYEDTSFLAGPRARIGSRASSTTASLSSSPASPTHFLRERLDNWNALNGVKRQDICQGEAFSFKDGRTNYQKIEQPNYGDENIFSFEKPTNENQATCVRKIDNDNFKLERTHIQPQRPQEIHHNDPSFHRLWPNQTQSTTEQETYNKYVAKHLQSHSRGCIQNSTKSYFRKNDSKSCKSSIAVVPPWYTRTFSTEARVNTNGITGQQVRIRKCVKNWEKHVTRDKKVYPRPDSTTNCIKLKEYRWRTFDNVGITKSIDQHVKKQECTESRNRAFSTVNNDKDGDDPSLLMSRLFISSKPDDCYGKSPDPLENRSGDLYNTCTPIQQCCKLFEDDLNNAFGHLSYLGELKANSGQSDPKNKDLKGYFNSQVAKFRAEYVHKVLRYEEHMNYHMSCMSRPSSSLELDSILTLDELSLSTSPSNISNNEDEKELDEDTHNSLENTLRDRTFDIWGPGELGLFAQTPNQLGSFNEAPSSSNSSTSNEDYKSN